MPVTACAFDALLFDLGGVVFEIDFGRMFARWAQDTGENADDLRARFSFDDAYARHERGEIAARDYFASLRTSLRIDLTDDRFLSGWTAIYLGEIPGVSDLLRSLAAQVPLYAFTNSNPAHRTVWATAYAETLKIFRHVFVSSDMGCRKPEPEAFAKIAAAIGVPLHRTLFFDDTAENVDGARAVGMQAVHVVPSSRAADIIAGSVRDLRPDARPAPGRR